MSCNSSDSSCVSICAWCINLLRLPSLLPAPNKLHTAGAGQGDKAGAISSKHLQWNLNRPNAFLTFSHFGLAHPVQRFRTKKMHFIMNLFPRIFQVNCSTSLVTASTGFTKTSGYPQAVRDVFNQFMSQCRHRYERADKRFWHHLFANTGQHGNWCVVTGCTLRYTVLPVPQISLTLRFKAGARVYRPPWSGHLAVCKCQARTQTQRQQNAHPSGHLGRVLIIQATTSWHLTSNRINASLET